MEVTIENQDSPSYTFVLENSFFSKKILEKIYPFAIGLMYKNNEKQIYVLPDDNGMIPLNPNVKSYKILTHLPEAPKGENKNITVF